MSDWLFKGKRVEGDVNICTLYGEAVTDDGAAATFGGGITRHHIIDIQMLQRFWNAVVARGDDDTMLALAKWAGEAQRLPKARPYGMLSTAAPDGLLKRVCWNPFNIVIGPNTNHRIGDPGDAFDLITFRSFPRFRSATGAIDPKAKAESLARQRFNDHIHRLGRIYGRMKEYVEFQASSDLTEAARGAAAARSVRSLLVSAVPGAYGLGFDGRGDGKLAILHPDLWADYSLTADRWFIKKGDDKKYGTILHDQERAEKANDRIRAANAKIAHLKETAPNSRKAKQEFQALKPRIVPYVSVSYFPDVPVEPAVQNPATTRVAAGLPKGTAMHTVDLDYAFLDRATCGPALERHLKPVLRFAATRPIDLYVCAPAPNPMFRDMAANIGAVVADWVAARGLKLGTVLYTGREADALEVRAYMP
jgi:hypothetical protein